MFQDIIYRRVISTISTINIVQLRSSRPGLSSRVHDNSEADACIQSMGSRPNIPPRTGTL